jgi:hypothetical protein
MQTDDLKNFVLDYFRINNARILESKNHITIQMPKRIAEKLNCELILNITFDKQYAEKNKDIDFIAKGAALLNKIISATEKRGLTVVKCYEGGAFTGLEMNFKVTFESIDKKERLLTYFVDLQTMKINNELLGGFKTKEFKECDSISLGSSVIEQCNLLCVEQIKNDVSSDVEQINNKLKTSMEKEKNIIEKFYDGIISDLRKKQEDKIRIWKDKKTKAHQSQYVEIREQYRKETEDYEEKILELQEKNFEELNSYFEIKQRRLKEIDNQYKLKIKLMLYSAALVIVK